MVTDMEESLEVYRDLLGFKVSFDDTIPGGGFFQAEEL